MNDLDKTREQLLEELTALRARVAGCEAVNASEAATRDREHLLRLALRWANAAAWHWDGGEHRVHWSPEMFELYGLDPTGPPLSLDEWLTIVDARDRDRVMQELEKSLTEQLEFDIPFRIMHPKRGERWLTALGRFLLSDQGGPPRALGITLDVTRSRQAEELLRHSESRLRGIFESSLVGMIYWEAGGAISEANQAFLDLLGYSREELREGLIRWDAITPEEWRQGDLECLEHLCRTGEAFPREKEYLHKDGRRVPVLLGGNFLEGYKDRGVSFVLDLTERKQLEEKLRQAQKMEAVGQLAGGIAHDFNNLLTVISGCSALVLSDMPTSDPNHSLIEEIRRAGDRAAGLTRQLLAFSRKQFLKPVTLDLNGTVLDLQKMLSRLIGETIELVAELDPQIGQVTADPGQIEQVIVNLALNARDAMPHGGRFTMRTRNVELRADEVRSRPHATARRYVQLSVSDSGCGMTPEVKAHLFEPFFTTKEVGKGTGLGLATVHGVVVQSEGFIEVESEPGSGTTFHIYLPRMDAQAATIGPSPAATAERGTETVLLVEDEDPVRRLVASVLQSYGYQVLTAQNGEEALELIERLREPIHLVVTDVVMPRMSGPQFIEALLPRYPLLKVLFLSGYAGDAVSRHGIADSGGAFLEKPFSPVMLANKVREILDGE